jgi:hypothetical protein
MQRLEEVFMALVGLAVGESLIVENDSDLTVLGLRVKAQFGER